MYGLYLDCKNSLSHHIGEKLYLNSLLSDVKFVFTSKSGDVEEIPAHRIMLATASSVLFDMLYGHLRGEDNDIPITDASIEAFREFLQFFYFDKVRLTPEHFVEVINLCKKFKLTGCITACIDSLQRSLTIDDACWAYGIALSTNRQNFVEFCEKKIKETPTEIFESESFLECDYELLIKMIILMSSECMAVDMINACMKWAKAQCKRNNLLRTPQNMRNSLGNLFNQIPFEKLSLEQLSQFTCSYKKIFTGKELRAITTKIMTKSLATKKLIELKIVENRLDDEDLKNVHILDCDRRLPGELVPMPNYGGDIFTTFSTNKQIVLKELYAKLHGTAICNGKIPYDINVNKFNHMERIACGIATVSEGTDQIHIILPQPVIIDASKLHSINIYTWNADCIKHLETTLWQPLLKHKIQKEDVEIRFKTTVNFDSDTISRLIFVRSNIAVFNESNWIIINSARDESNKSSDDNEETISR